MPRPRPPLSSSSSQRIMQISSPLPHPSPAHSFAPSPAPSPSPGLETDALNPYSDVRNYPRRSPVGQNGGRGVAPSPSPVGGRRRFDEYDLSPSPTHAYLEEFTSNNRNPSHTPIPQSYSLNSMPSSPHLDFSADGDAEKDPFTESSRPGVGVGALGYNQYDSDRYLNPNGQQDNHDYAYGSSYANTRSGPGGPGGMAAFEKSRSLRPNVGGSRDGGLGGSGSTRKPYESKRTCIPASKTKRRWIFFGIPIALVIIAGVVVGVVVAVTKKSSTTTGSGSSAAGNGTSTGTGSTNGTSSAVTNGTDASATKYVLAGSGTDGSTVTTDLGVQFTYTNKFGGSWAQDPSNPYSVGGKAQSWSPSVLETWTWGSDIARGVNLGGWLVTEPFIVPGLYERYQTSTPQAVDEYTLTQAIGKANLTAVMDEHYRTFITEKDFADIAAAGLNFVRIPLGYWAIETEFDEPFLPKLSWTYFTKAIAWSRKYGIRILLDFHALPGSQNGWNHSGKSGVVNWMYGVMGIANAQRHLEYLRTLTEYISQPGIKEVVPILSLVNEVQSTVVGMDVLRDFYYQAYTMIRGITGFGSGNGPMIAIHEGFAGIAAWDGFLAGADRIALDQHPYLAFGTQNNNAWSQQAAQACGWGGGTNDTQAAFGVVLGGEWSAAINNCGKWLNGVNSQASYETTGTGNCTEWEEWFNWTADRKTGMQSYIQANMDALQNWFFWTWRIGNSTVLGYAPSPMWHYQLGLQQGWIPADPRTAGGYCKTLNIGGSQFNGSFPSSATGAVPSPTIATDQVASYNVWPPTSMGPSFSSAQIAFFPTLTQTGTPITLQTPATTGTPTVSLGNGWNYAADTSRAWVTVTGCTYPDEYNATAVAVPTAKCTGS